MKVNDYVRSTLKPAWGSGKILEIWDGTKARVFFEEAGELRVLLKDLVLDSAPSKDHILARVTKDSKNTEFKSMHTLERTFFTQFPLGFDDPNYQKGERGYKDDAAKMLVELLGRDVFIGMLDSGEYQEIAKRALRVIGKTNLIFPNESMALSDGLKKTDKHLPAFAKRLYHLLYEPSANGSHFDEFVGVLDEIGALKWTIATYFPFLSNPQKEFFVKPTFTQAAANAFLYDIAYESTPNWKIYVGIRNFAEHVRQELLAKTALNPRDLMDVQSFVWCAQQSAVQRS